MKLVGELKKQVEETNNKEEAKEIIEKAGMELTDEELDCVNGGFEVPVTTGDENDLFQLKGKLNGTNNDDQNAEISVDAGDGFDLLRLFGQSIKHKFEYKDGKFHMQ